MSSQPNRTQSLQAQLNNQANPQVNQTAEDPFDDNSAMNRSQRSSRRSQSVVKKVQKREKYFLTVFWLIAIGTLAFTVYKGYQKALDDTCTAPDDISSWHKQVQELQAQLNNLSVQNEVLQTQYKDLLDQFIQSEKKNENLSRQIEGLQDARLEEKKQRFYQWHFKQSNHPTARCKKLADCAEESRALNCKYKPAVELIDDYKVTAIAFSQDESELITGTSNFVVSLWNTTSGQKKSIFEADIVGEEVSSVSFSSNNEYVAAGGKKGSIVVWNTKDSSIAYKASENQQKITQIQFSPNSNLLVYVNSGGKQLSLSFEKGQFVNAQICNWDQEKVKGVTFSGDGSRLAAHFESKKVRVCELKSKQITQVQGQNYQAINAISLSQDGKKLVVCQQNGDVIITVDNSMQKHEILAKTHLQYVEFAHFFGRNNYFVTGAWDNTVALWDSSKNHKIAEFSVPIYDTQTAIVSKNALHIATIESGRKSVWLSTFECAKSFNK